MGVILGYYQDQIPLVRKGWNSECVPPWEYSRKMFCSWKSKSKDKNLFYSHIKEQKLNKNRFPDWLIFSWSEAIDRDVINGSSHIQENRARFLKLCIMHKSYWKNCILFYKYPIMFVAAVKVFSIPKFSEFDPIVYKINKDYLKQAEAELKC